jgi:hypothetical protein
MTSVPFQREVRRIYLIGEASGLHPCNDVSDSKEYGLQALDWRGTGVFHINKVLWDSSIGITKGYRLDDRRIWVSFPTFCPDRFWDPPTILSTEYRETKLQR